MSEPQPTTPFEHVVTAIKTLVLTIVMLAIFILWAAGGQRGAGNFAGDIKTIASAPQEIGSVTNVTVMTWNIAFGYGEGSAGQGYDPKPRDYYVSQLSKMAAVIKANQADIVLLQEIDIDADRSARIDQLEMLAHEAGLGYGAYAPSWQANYVPFPYWPPSRQFGRVRSGGAVLSRFPISTNRVYLHRKPEANPWWYNLFYLYRYTQWVQIDIDQQAFWIINNHLEAFDRETRRQQAAQLATLIERKPAGEAILLFGGDMNALPELAAKRADFAGYPNDDYRDDKTMAILNAVPGFAETVSDAAYSNDPNRYLTFPAGDPDRRLDYLFVTTRTTTYDTRIVRTGPLSDHLPVVTTVNLQDL